MLKLHPFSALIQPIEVQAQCAPSGRRILFTFELSDPAGRVEDSLLAAAQSEWPRADELWKTTCFEAFFGPVGQVNYWELNLSPSRQSWNLYSFDGYRLPQPPRRSEDFALTKVAMTARTLQAELSAKTDLPSLEFSLCAVIRTLEGTHHFALRHSGARPDFHLRESFGQTLA